MSIYLQRDDILDAFSRRVAEFYGGFTPLKRRGDQFVGPCPIHGGEGLNFKVNPDSGGWYCHSQCGRGGDVFAFLQLARGLQYGDALKHLADFTGMGTYPTPPPPGHSPGPSAAPSLTPPSPARVSSPPTPSFFPLPFEGRVADLSAGIGSSAYAPPLPPPLCLPDPDSARLCHEKLMADDERVELLRVHRGLTRETLVRFGIGLTYATGSDLDAEIPHPRITFPVYDREGVLINIRKHMFAWTPDLDRQKLAKTLPWDRGLPAGLFPRGVVQGADHLLLIEGEPDALLANQMGFPAVSGTGGAGGWNPRCTRELAGIARVTILYDSDDAGRKGAKARARDLSGVVPDIRIAELPPGLGKDLTEWVIDGGGTPEELARLVDKAVSSSAPEGLLSLPLREGGELVRRVGSLSGASHKSLPARIVDLADIPLPPAELPYLWGPYLNQGASHWLTGRTGLGKSTFAFNLACALAEGRTLWGIPCRACRLLYVDMESGDLGRSLKIQRLFKEREAERPPLRGQLLFVREPLRLPDESAELIAFALEHRFDLVIFDTARRVFAVKDENDNAEVYNRIVPTLDALKGLGVATLTMGHPPKNGGLSARGAGAQEDAGDINLLLTMHSGEVTDPAGVISLTITKNRLLGLGQPPLYLRRIGGDLFERVETGALPPADPDPEKLAPRDRCRAAILVLLESNHGKPVSYGDLWHGLEAQGHTRMTLHRAVKELMDEGEVTQPASGRYLLSDPFA